MSPSPRITTDWRGRATRGRWWGDYYMAWIAANDRSRCQPGCWCVDQHGRDWWVTDTAEWDRAFFAEWHVKPPKRFGERSRFVWVDEGDGLRSGGYRAPSRHWPLQRHSTEATE